MNNSEEIKFGHFSPNYIQKFFILIGRNTPILKTFFRTRLNRLYLKLKNHLKLKILIFLISTLVKKIKIKIVLTIY